MSANFKPAGTDENGAAQSARNAAAVFDIIERGDIRTVKKLLEEGSLDPNNPIVHYGDRYVLHCAARAGQLGIVKLLLQHGASPDAVEDWFGFTPLHAAASAGHVDVIQTLLPLCNPSLQSHYGFTAAALAQKKGFSSAVAALASASGGTGQQKRRSRTAKSSNR